MQFYSISDFLPRRVRARSEDEDCGAITDVEDELDASVETQVADAVECGRHSEESDQRASIEESGKCV